MAIAALAVTAAHSSASANLEVFGIKLGVNTNLPSCRDVQFKTLCLYEDAGAYPRKTVAPFQVLSIPPAESPSFLIPSFDLLRPFVNRGLPVNNSSGKMLLAEVHDGQIHSLNFSIMASALGKFEEKYGRPRVEERVNDTRYYWSSNGGLIRLSCKPKDPNEKLCQAYVGTGVVEKLMQQQPDSRRKL